MLDRCQVLSTTVTKSVSTTLGFFPGSFFRSIWGSVGVNLAPKADLGELEKRRGNNRKQMWRTLCPCMSDSWVPLQEIAKNHSPRPVGWLAD